MSHTAAICQPHYLPWIGYFEMIDRVDTFVFLDDVQFIKREWKNRNRIRKAPMAPDGKWLTVPVVKEDQRARICDARVANHDDWVSEHLESIRHVYRHTAYLDSHLDALARLLDRHRAGSLADLNICLLRFLCEALGIGTRCVASSELKVEGKREEKLLKICQTLGVTHYLANNATGEYVSADYFTRHGIQFELQHYSHPVYAQHWRGKPLPFLSHLSVVDLLFNHGPDSLSIIKQGRP